MISAIEIRQVGTVAERRTFIRLPWRIHCRHTAWVPPLLSDEKRFIDPSKNLAFSYSDAVLALAYRDGVACGRIMGIINYRHNARVNQHIGRFSNLECPNEQEVAKRLLQFVEEWARRRGMEKLVGPMGFTDQDPEGYRVQGFEHQPTIGTYTNFPYLNDLLRACGYEKEVDYVVYRVPVPRNIPASYDRVVRRISAGGHVRAYEFRRRSDLKPFAKRILSLMNDTFSDLYGFVPLDEAEIKLLARRFLPIVDPRFVKFATVDGHDAAFLLGMPNIDEGMRKANGRLFPFGILHIMNAARRAKQLDLLVGGVKQEYRSYGLAVLGLAMLLHAARKAGMQVIDSHLELETNLRMRAEMERMGGTLSKRYRIYSKVL